MIKNATYDALVELVGRVDSHTGYWVKTPKKIDNGDGTISFLPQEHGLAWEVNRFLWVYSGQLVPNDSQFITGSHNFIYPNIDDWSGRLKKAIDDDSFNTLTKDEVYSFIFGLHHRNRINDGLWCGMFKNGIMQRLLHRLIELDKERKNEN